MAHSTSKWTFYSTPTVLSPSDDSTVSAIVAEIPFFIVGILALAVFTFFVFLKRVDRTSTLLCISCLFAFIGVNFDLSQIIVRGNATSPVSGSARALITLREIFLAFSLAFRYLYFWAFVARRPRGEVDTPMEGRRQLQLVQPSPPPQPQPHSAAWVRWGAAGSVLQYALLADIIGILSLQLVWRLVPAYGRMGTAYTASAALEISIAIVLMCKLGVNVAFTSVTPRMSVMQYYMIPMVALFSNVGIAIGALLCFAFTETTLGRFLQAVQLYFLVLFTLVDAFLPNKAASMPTIGPVLPLTLERASTFRITLPGSISTPEEVPQLPRPPPVRPPRPPSNRRQSSGARSSASFGWITRRSYLRQGPPVPAPYDSDNEHLWTDSQAERGESPMSFGISEEKLHEEDEEEFETKEFDPMYLAMLTESPPEREGVLGKVPFASPASITPPAAIAEGGSKELVPQRPDTVFSEDWNITVLSPEGERVTSSNAPPLPPMDVPARASSLQRRSFLSLSTTDASASTPSVERIPPDELVTPPLPSQAQTRSITRSELQAGPRLGDTLAPPRRISGTQGMDSPVYGLMGVRKSSPSPAPRTAPVPRASFLLTPSSPTESHPSTSARDSFASSETGIQELLRQQQELERSIAKLRILNPGPTETVGWDDVAPRSSMSSRDAAHQSTSTVLTLSDFPAPPWERRRGTPPVPVTPTFPVSPAMSEDGRRGEVQMIPSSSSPATPRASQRTSKLRSPADTGNSPLVPPKIPFVNRRLSVPGSARGSVDSLQSIGGPHSRSRFDSQGTQYEITSFIGGFSSRESGSDSDNTGSSAIVATASRSSAAKAQLLSPTGMTSRPRPSLLRNERPADTEGPSPFSPNELSGPHTGGISVDSPAASSSTSRTTPRQRVDSPSGGSSSTSYMPPPRGTSPLGVIGSKIVGLPARPQVRPDKSMISGPLPLGVVRPAKKAFERPRPAPLTFKDPSASRRD